MINLDGGFLDNPPMTLKTYSIALMLLLHPVLLMARATGDMKVCNAE
jgi:hypothetical protein